MRSEFKRSLRSGFHAMADRSGLLNWCERRMAAGVTILTYHRVLADELCRDYPFAALAMPASAFRRQMEWLADHCRVLTVAEALRTDVLQNASERPIVCLTFDDGYRDNYSVAAQILNSLRLRGTFFATVGFIGTQNRLWFDHAASQWQALNSEQRRAIACHVKGEAGKELRVDEFRCWMQFLKQCDPAVRTGILERGPTNPDMISDGCYLMTLDQLVALHRMGHEIGSHTMSHPLLPQLDDEQLTTELVESRLRLQQLLQAEIPGFCYPNGDCNDRVAAAVEAAGYRYACTTRHQMATKSSDPFRLPRVEVNSQKVVRAGRHDDRAFRSELCRLEKAWR